VFLGQATVSSRSAKLARLGPALPGSVVRPAGGRAGSFRAAVLSVVRRIPAGCVTTYGDVARLAGRPGAARAVGQLLAAATVDRLPYHRVVGAEGALGGYGSGPTFKAARLTAEGVLVRRGRIVGFRDVHWSG
jgi:O-6-methylguanine DNA methyltransferase